MLLHTIIPPEAFAEQPASDMPMCVCCSKGFLEVNSDTNGNFTISRIISTDPAVYLDEKFSPGSIFSEALLSKFGQ